MAKKKANVIRRGPTRIHRGRKIVERRWDGQRYYTVRFRFGNEMFDTVREARQYIDYMHNDGF